MCLMFPFRHIERYFTLQLIKASSLYWLHTEYFYFQSTVQCDWFLEDKHPSQSILYYTLQNVECTLPVFPIILSCILSVYTLVGEVQITPDRSKREATITIICFTFMYIIFNVPVVVTTILLTVNFACGWKYDFFSFDSPANYFITFINVHSVALNAALNTIIYFWRMKKVRQHVIHIILSVLNYTRNIHDRAARHVRANAISTNVNE